MILVFGGMPLALTAVQTVSIVVPLGAFATAILARMSASGGNVSVIPRGEDVSGVFARASTALVMIPPVAAGAFVGDVWARGGGAAAVAAPGTSDVKVDKSHASAE